MFFFLIFTLLIVSCSSDTRNNYTKIDLNFYNEEIMKQGEIVVSTMASSSKILHDIACQILINNLDACKESIITAFGIMVAEPKDLPENLKTSYSILFGENLF